MRLLKVAVSNDAPSVKDCLWAKPAAGAFSLYLLDGGVWKPLELVNPGNLSTTTDDTLISNEAIYEAIGTLEDDDNGGGGGTQAENA